QAPAALALRKYVIGEDAERLAAERPGGRGVAGPALLPPPPDSDRARAPADRDFSGSGDAVVARDRARRRPPVRVPGPLDQRDRVRALHRLGHFRFGGWPARPPARSFHSVRPGAGRHQRQPPVREPLFPPDLPAAPPRVLVT